MTNEMNSAPQSERDHEWIDLLWKAFGEKGVVALAFWIGSSFANETRGHGVDYPILHVSGDRASGKSTLIQFLWSLLGRPNYEGFDPFSLSHEARRRKFAEVERPVVLLADRAAWHERSGFDWSEISNANGSGDGLRSAIVIVGADIPVSIASTSVHIDLSAKCFTPESQRAALALQRTSALCPGELLSGVRDRERFLVGVLKDAESLTDGMSMLGDRPDPVRTKNHALIMALINCMHQVVPVTDEMRILAQGAVLNSLAN